MQFTIEREAIRKYFPLISRTAGVRTLMPVLENVLIQAQENQVTLMATNTENSCIINLDAEVKEGGKATFPAKLGNEILSSLSWSKEEFVEFNLKQEGLAVICGDTQFELPVLDPEEFPEISPVAEGDTCKIDFQIFKEAVRSVKFAVSSDVLKENLKGIFFKIFTIFE